MNSIFRGNLEDHFDELDIYYYIKSLEVKDKGWKYYYYNPNSSKFNGNQEAFFQRYMS